MTDEKYKHILNIIPASRGLNVAYDYQDYLQEALVIAHTMCMQGHDPLDPSFPPQFVKRVRDRAIDVSKRNGLYSKLFEELTFVQLDTLGDDSLTPLDWVLFQESQVRLDLIVRDIQKVIKGKSVKLFEYILSQGDAPTSSAANRLWGWSRNEYRWALSRLRTAVASVQSCYVDC